MAVSPTFNTSNQYIKYRIVVTENYTSISNNSSNITVEVQVWRTNSGYTSYGTGTCYCGINDSTYSQGISSSQKFTYNSYTTVFSKTLDIYHNDDGSKSIWVSSLINHSVFSTSDQGFSVTLSTIPRYSSANQSISSKTETDITVNWWSDNTIDYLWYSKNNGLEWYGIDISDSTEGSYTISGLIPGELYGVRTKLRRRDSQLTSETSTIYVRLYDYPYATSSSDFVIGNGAEVTIYNPLRRTYTCTIYGEGGIAMGSYTGSDALYINGEFRTPEAIDAQYRSIPNSQSGQYIVKVFYGSNVATRSGGTYRVNPDDCRPTITSVAYEDRNSTTTAITGDNQDIVQNCSVVHYAASGVTAQRYASVSSCSVTVNGSTYNLSLNNGTWSGGNAVINSGSNVVATFTAVDSRGVTATKTINVHMLSWSPPSAIVTLNRQDNYYSNTYIMVDADYSQVNGNNQVTITYKAKKSTESTYTISGTLTDGVTSTFTADNEYDWDVVVTVTDLLGGQATYNAWLSRGIPIVYFDRLNSSVGVNCFPQNTKSFEVSGSTNFQGALNVSGAVGMQGTLNVSDAVSMQNSLSVQGALSVSSSANFYDSLTIYGALYVGWTLYDNASGTSSTITLSSYAYNFRWLEIAFCSNDGMYETKSIISPHGKKMSLISATTYGGGGYIKLGNIYILDNIITWDGATEVYIVNGSNVGSYDAQYIKIVMVRGYK